MRIKLSPILFVLVVTLSMISCASNNDVVDSPLISYPDSTDEVHYPTRDDLFKACKLDTNVIKYRFGGYISNDTAYLSGLYDGYLWFAYYKQVSNDMFKKIKEWRDIEKLPLTLSFYQGYGNYKTLYLAEFPNNDFWRRSTVEMIQNEKFNQTSFITLNLRYTKEYGDGNLENLVDINANIIVDRNETKFRKYQELGSSRNIFIKWFQHSQLLRNNIYDLAKYNVYSERGDSICTLYGIYPTISNDWINERLKIDVKYSDKGIYFIKSDYSKEERDSEDGIWRAYKIWTSKILSYGFDIPRDAQIKLSSYEIKKKDNIWDYMLHFIFYDGTKKDVSVRLDINTGEIKRL